MKLKTVFLNGDVGRHLRISRYFFYFLVCSCYLFMCPQQLDLVDLEAVVGLDVKIQNSPLFCSHPFLFAETQQLDLVSKFEWDSRFRSQNPIYVTSYAFNNSSLICADAFHLNFDALLGGGGWSGIAIFLILYSFFFYFLEKILVCGYIFCLHI